MSETFYPQDGPDHVPEEDLHALSVENYQNLEQKFLHDAQALRTAAVAKLEIDGALQEFESWAIYYIHHDSSDEYDGPHHTEVLLKLDQYHDGAGLPAIVRIMTNELYPNGEHMDWFTQDFILDEDNDSFYFIDAVRFDEDENDAAYNHSCSPIFFTDGDDNLRIANAGEFPDSTAVTWPGDWDRYALPFGDTEHLEDRVAALEKGIEILQTILHTEPEYISVNY